MKAKAPIAVRRYGTQGPEVVLLHGGPGGQGSVASLARELAKDYRVLEPLQRRSGDIPLTVDRHVRDLADVAPDKAALVGWSWGAMLALSFAAHHQDRVNSLALIGCGTYDLESRRAYEREMEKRLGPEGRLQTRNLRLRIETETDPARRDNQFEDMERLAALAQAYDPIDDCDEPMIADSLGCFETWRDVLRLQREGMEPALFSAIGVPVLMLHGDDDPHPGPATRDILHRHIPHIEYAAFERCGHRPWLERHARDRFLETLRNWLRSNCF